jgi:SAM-dependent methyltransferase
MNTDNCRFCENKLSQIFLDLGTTPLSNSFLNKSDLNNDEPFFPLQVYVCEKCYLFQLKQFKTPNEIFSNYAYFSSYSSSWLKHAENYVNMIVDRFSFNQNSLVVELASNDGYLLQYFNKKNIPVLGIEPAENIAKIAIENNINTTVDFFSENLAYNLKNNGKQADLIIANNVLAHVPELNDFVEGIKILLKNNGIATIEFPYLLNLIEENQFDTIYHEHFSYFSLFTVMNIFSFHDLKIFDVEEIPTHGGSLRLYIKHKKNNIFSITDNVKIVLDKEKEAKLDDINTYKLFSNKVYLSKQKLNNFFELCKKSNKKIIGYGAPAKGNTLLNFCKIDSIMLPFTVDKSLQKQGLYLPGTHIPIKSPEEIKKSKPDYLLILPWNLQNEIMDQMHFIRDWGGKFVIPIPEVKII